MGWASTTAESLGTSPIVLLVAEVSAGKVEVPSVTSGRLSGVRSLVALVRTGSVEASWRVAATGSAAGAVVDD